MRTRDYESSDAFRANTLAMLASENLAVELARCICDNYWNKSDEYVTACLVEEGHERYEARATLLARKILQRAGINYRERIE